MLLLLAVVVCCFVIYLLQVQSHSDVMVVHPVHDARALPPFVSAVDGVLDGMPLYAHEKHTHERPNRIQLCLQDREDQSEKCMCLSCDNLPYCELYFNPVKYGICVYEIKKIQSELSKSNLLRSESLLNLIKLHVFLFFYFLSIYLIHYAFVAHIV